jgi:hypothetical protein
MHFYWAKSKELRLLSKTAKRTFLNIAGKQFKILLLSVRKLRTMQKTFILFLFIVLAVTVRSQEVFSVEYAHQADVKVFVADYEHQADLSVFKVDYGHQADDNEGKWFFVEYAHQADKKIFFVDYKHQADVTIYFVEYSHQSGWNDKSKKHLFY